MTFPGLGYVWPSGAPVLPPAAGSKVLLWQDDFDKSTAGGGSLGWLITFTGTAPALQDGETSMAGRGAAPGILKLTADTSAPNAFCCTRRHSKGVNLRDITLDMAWRLRTPREWDDVDDVGSMSAGLNDVNFGAGNPSVLIFQDGATPGVGWQLRVQGAAGTALFDIDTPIVRNQWQWFRVLIDGPAGTVRVWSGDTYQGMALRLSESPPELPLGAAETLGANANTARDTLTGSDGPVSLDLDYTHGIVGFPTIPR